MTKYFMFVETNHFLGETRSFHPYYSEWINQLGVTNSKRGALYTEEQILSIDFSETKKKKIIALKEGKRLTLREISPGVEIGLMRVSEDYIECLKTTKSLETEIAAVLAEINSLIPAELQDRLQRLQKELKSAKKNLF